MASKQFVNPFKAPLLLGSASYSRRYILDQHKIPFTKCARPIDEKALGDRLADAPSDLVTQLATAKMEHLLNEMAHGNCANEMKQAKKEFDTPNDEFLVLTADQVVVCRNQILEKPESVEQAIEFCSQYPQHAPSTVGALVLAHWPSRTTVAGVDMATIHFAPFDAKSLVQQLVVEQDAPILSCAGGLMVEHELVQPLVTLEGTQDSVMGLSVDLLERLLHELYEKVKSS